MSAVVKNHPVMAIEVIAATFEVGDLVVGEIGIAMLVRAKVAVCMGTAAIARVRGGK